MDHHIFCLKGARRKFSLEVESPMSARDWKQRRRGGSGVAAAAEAGWLALLPTTPAVAAVEEDSTKIARERNQRIL